MRRVRTRRRRGIVIAMLLLLSHVGEAQMGEDKGWVRCCHRVVIVAIIIITCQGG